MMAPSNVNSLSRASPSCRRRSTVSRVRHPPPQRGRARNTRPPARLPKTRTSRKLPPNTTNCGYAIAAQRAALQRLRERGEIGEEALHRIQEELDWSELDAAPAGSFQSLAS